MTDDEFSYEPRLPLGKWGTMSREEQITWLTRVVQANSDEAERALAAYEKAEERLDYRMVQLWELLCGPGKNT